MNILLTLIGLLFSLSYFSHYQLFESSPESTHFLYQIIPRSRAQFQWYDIGRRMTWALFGNEDDGIFGEDAARPFRPELGPSYRRAALWFLRNPLHNFCFYVIGSADSENSAFIFLQASAIRLDTLLYQKEAKTTFFGEGDSLYVALHGGKPFFSCSFHWGSAHLCRFYIGWRHRGNFGIKWILK